MFYTRTFQLLNDPCFAASDPKIRYKIFKDFISLKKFEKKYKTAQFNNNYVHNQLKFN